MTNIGSTKGWLLAAITCSLLGFFGCKGKADFVIEDRNEQSCSAPQPGVCTVVSECEPVMNLIRTQGVQSAEAQKYLRQSRCGYAGLNPKVCCPTGRGNPNAGTTTAAPDEPFDNPLDLLPRSCGRDLGNRVIGGEATNLDEYPWMALIEYDSARGVQTGCGGALISNRYVLTAAHCIRAAPSNWRLARVRLGEYNLRTDPDCVDDGAGGQNCADRVTVVPVERAHVHEDYMTPERLHNDIALLRLARNVPYTTYVQPICLPATGTIVRNYWAAGWGQTEDKASSDVKLKVNVPTIDFQQCASIYAKKNVILGSGQMCAGGVAGKDTCKGDSGGPLMRQVQQNGGANRWVIDGVVSFGYSPCGLPGWPAVYTKVHGYVPWILSKLKP